MLHVKKKPFAAAFISVLLVSALAGTLLVDLGKADGSAYYYPEIYVISPQNSRTYTTNSVDFTFHGDSFSWGTVTYSDVQYYLDGSLLGKLNGLSSPFSVTLTGLSEGNHVVRVTAVVVSIQAYSDPISQWISFHYILPATPYQVDIGIIGFSVNIPPTVSILSPGTNEKYPAYNVPLNFTVNKSFLQVSYSLDGQANVTHAKNTTLTGLSEGSHTLTLYATDTAGNTGQSETIRFTIAQETQPQQPEPSQTAPQSESFPTTLVAAIAVVILAAVSVSLLVYFRKRKR
jgi:hypothetical protein